MERRTRGLTGFDDVKAVGTTRKSRRRTRGKLRLFVAADPPETVREAAAAWGREVARVTAGLRPVPAENCHITLAFLGDREERELEAIRSTLRMAVGPEPGTASPAVSFGAPIWLPPRRPRALALEIHDDTDQLHGLHRQVAENLERAIEWNAKRNFRPHLTAARTGRGFDPDALRLPISPGLEFRIESVALYSSTLLPEGALYEAQERIGLEPR